jgi:hypothetical protein
LKDKDKNIANATERDVIWAVTHPIQKQKLQITELTVLLFLSKDPVSNKYLITIGEYTDNEYILRQCLKLRSDLIEKVGTDEPLVLLRQLANNFGIEQKVGEQKSKFFFRESVKVRIGTKRPKLMSIFPHEKEVIHVVYGLYYIYREETGIVEIALAFSLDADLYTAWLEDHTNITLSPKKYEVFISYKRNTAKDFALHLKQCLTEEGYGAFLDLKDIKKEFLGTAKWFDERDQAIRNSKRFLLIMTIMVDSSKEVANELTLARTVPNMKFIYMRHNELEPQIILKADNNEIIDLSEGNQETFYNEDDLVRKVFQILQESKD